MANLESFKSVISRLKSLKAQEEKKVRVKLNLPPEALMGRFNKKYLV